MRHALAFAFALAFLALSACSAPGASTRARPYSGGMEQPSARAAVDGNGDLSEPQELVGVNLPLGPFTVKGGVLWNGTTWMPGLPLAQAADECAPAPSVAPSACAESAFAIVEEPYTVRVPVQTYREETRVRRFKVTTTTHRTALPECSGGCCCPPTEFVAPSSTPCVPPAPELGAPPADAK